MFLTFALCLAGLVGMAGGFMGIVRPIPEIGLRTRKRAFALLMLSSLFALIVLAYQMTDGSNDVSSVPSRQASVDTTKLARGDLHPTNPVFVKFAERALEDDLTGALISRANTLSKPRDALNTLGLSVHVQATDYSADYHGNEIAADEKYRGKSLLISGIVTGISKDALDLPYVSLRGDNEFWSVQARLTPEAAETAKSFRKGQKVNLVCKGGGMTLTFPIARDCEDYNSYMSEQRPDLTRTINSFLMGEAPLPRSEGKGVIAAYILADKLPATSPCFSDIQTQACAADINKLRSQPALKEESASKMANFQSYVHYSD